MPWLPYFSHLTSSAMQAFEHFLGCLTLENRNHTGIIKILSFGIKP